MEWWIAVCAVVLSASAAWTSWQAARLMRRLGSLVTELESGSTAALKEITGLAADARGALEPMQDAALQAKRQLDGLASLAEAAGSLRAAADTAGVTARRIIDGAAGTADAAAERMRQAAGKYRPQLEEAIGIADAALEGWMYIRSAAAKLRTSACSDREIGNPIAERREQT
ncbi:hypothetical protein SAMN05444162_0520 [Paenibacillaceae bacterium GAS479]|nr:hypothetical protein SAMN05444162_0520 [Paenibacillaceae bacterium GAS479]